MKKNHLLANGFGILAVLLMALAVGIAVRFRSEPAMVLSISEEAAATADKVMEAICAGDYAAAESLMYGEPDLGLDRPASDEVADMIWEAFEESRTYELVGECEARSGGICQNVRLRSMDFASVTENLEQRTQTLLTKRVEQAKDVSQIYDENDAYQESVVEEVVREAVEDALREDARYVEQELTLTLTYSNGKWWVMPDTALLNAISGGIAG